MSDVILSLSDEHADRLLQHVRGGFVTHDIILDVALYNEINGQIRAQRAMRSRIAQKPQNGEANRVSEPEPTTPVDLNS